MRVLIIEDNEFFRTELDRFVRTLPNLEVAGCARCGNEGIEAFHRTKPDLVLTDIIMAPTNGLETLRQIRAASAATKIIMMSLHSLPDLEQRVKGLGADGFVHKSRIFDDLPKLIAQLSTGEEK
jgi:two-component system invasion response regulator UvrY